MPIKDPIRVKCPCGWYGQAAAGKPFNPCPRCGGAIGLTKDVPPPRSIKYPPVIARPCAYCGTSFTPERSELNKGGGKYCKVECYRAVRSESPPHREWSSPAGTAEQKHKASQWVTNGVKLGWFNRGKQCQKCGSESPRIIGHHPDYTKFNVVYWLCVSCHTKAHIHADFLAGLTPIVLRRPAWARVVRGRGLQLISAD